MLKSSAQGPQLRFGVLGPVAVWDEHGEIAIGPGHERVLLALLLVRAGGLIETWEIEKALWEGDSPRTATNMIHRYVSLLRRHLEPALPPRSGGSFIVSDGSGYRLTPPPGGHDLIDFRARVQRARERAQAGDHGAAVQLFVSALDAWRGRAGAGLGLAAQAFPDFVAVERDYVNIAREAADSALQSRGTKQVLPALREASVRSPLDEALHARLLLALAADGKPAEAVSLYGTLRARLAEDLGVDAGPELQAAFRSVLRGGTGADTAPPRPAGSEEISVRPARLPSDMRLFVGRTEQVREGSALIRRPGGAVPIVAYDGMPGVGKTTLVVHLAHQVAGAFPDGRLYVDLHGSGAPAAAADPVDVLADLLAALGLESHTLPAGLEARAALYRSVLTGRRVLVVLDNARDAEQVRLLLPGAGGNAVLVTSRGRLSTLATAYGAEVRTLDVPGPAEARTCFEARLGVPPARADRIALDEIVERTGRLPIALSIVAARVAADPLRSLVSVAAGLRQAAGALDAVPDDRIGSELRSVLTWSSRFLSPPSAQLLRVLSQQPPGDITAGSAAALAGIPAADATRHLTELLRNRLLNRLGPGRFGVHELVRAYAAQREPHG